MSIPRRDYPKRRSRPPHREGYAGEAIRVGGIGIRIRLGGLFGGDPVPDTVLGEGQLRDWTGGPVDTRRVWEISYLISAGYADVKEVLGIEGGRNGPQAGGQFGRSPVTGRRLEGAGRALLWVAVLRRASRERRAGRTLDPRRRSAGGRRERAVFISEACYGPDAAVLLRWFRVELVLPTLNLAFLS